MKKKKTLRLLLPQWQGGDNPNYVFGSELLAHIVPQSTVSETVRISVNQDFEKDRPIEQGVKNERALMKQLDEAMAVLENKAPDKVIVLGGDCAVSQAPFDYLNGRYGGKLGILWLDAHPDVATTEETSHGHEMVLGNLLGEGAPAFAEKVKHPFQPNQVMFAGLKYEELRSRDQAVNRLNLRYVTPQDVKDSSEPILAWIKENDIQYLAVHFDLDVLSPIDFRSTYFSEPYLEEFGAAVGELTLNQIVRILTDASEQAEIVGLSIAEHLPWDAMNLRQALAKISIFDDSE
ncbi:arginase family protein [Enterococcus sp. BWR-S5]|uniref:arginase family protein n=1 Tax=Enterococcus sp. BWR-S5 TaxID=2787714 RepID=UPI0019232D87|nr:arginase family protein [Enterococcus sp. BWR-S5]MBL1225734.1 arginase family protein [Enterococcus sp. BWR-S5]